ncbi:hypothetical protein [Ponticaulis koreensis]|uniref:hypothetical protein n=1 Tax=Ponticaulis koreensis TaxID=1123045 RepID=UPI0003B58799|nr:hypothetical protein [Ponticaulis koreensis]
MKFIKAGGHILIVIILTVLTQLGGLAWLVALRFKRRLLTFIGIYAALSVASIWIAPQFGRIPLNCWASPNTASVQSPLFCTLNRHYVTPELKAVLQDTAASLTTHFPDAKLRVLDAGFPYINDFPLLPHLSHHDGRKADIALFYEDGTGTYLPGRTRSPIGYFAFEEGPTDCAPSQLSLRWDFDWLQAAWPDWQLEEERTRRTLELLSADERVRRIFIEPHLKARLGLTHEVIRFQGCRAARHDDHIHIEARS